MNKIILLLVLILSFNLQAQKIKKYEFNKITSEERAMKIYDLDTTATAVFISEYGYTKFEQKNSEIIISTTYYAKLKIFSKEGFDFATVEIPIARNKNSSEKIKNIKAITHNGSKQSHLAQKDIFTTKDNEFWSTVSFTMPDIQEQSIIEYEYTLDSPFKFNFTGWEFQDDIPKMYSEFHALIPGNYLYNRHLNGFQKLAVNDAKIKKRCFSVTGVSREADCEELTYAMANVPAFIEEDYMTSRKNYISAINFELSEYRGFSGDNFKYTKTWKDADKEFKGEQSIGRQLKKVDYLKKRIPNELLTGDKSLQHAIQIYEFIKAHFTWNKKYNLFTDVKVKEAFENKVGNSAEINISLVNAFKAAGFDVELMLLATRNQGFPTTMHPVMTDFNYAIAKLNINKQSFLLDATLPDMSFGLLPFNLLNGYGRVMNFNKGSYWHDIVPHQQNQTRTFLKLELDINGSFKGQLNTNKSGYHAYNKRSLLADKNEDEYLSDFEEKSEGLDLKVQAYTNKNLNDLQKNLSETFDIEMETDLSAGRLIINPFLYNKITTNPFNLTDRTYPIDFGYPFKHTYMLKLSIPEHYKLSSSIPTSGLKLPNDGGEYQFVIEQKGQVISLISKIDIKKSQYHPDEYEYLKEFFKQIIKTQKSYITLEKI